MEDLKALPADQLAQAADYIHRLRSVDRPERNLKLRSMAGVLEGYLGEQFAQDIKEGCDQVDGRDW